MTAFFSIAQTVFCGGLCFVIAFIYRRGESNYKFLPSLCAFALASLFGQQWLNLVMDAVYTGKLPRVDPYSTMIFGILFLLALRSRGNVARFFG